MVWMFGWQEYSQASWQCFYGAEHFYSTFSVKSHHSHLIAEKNEEETQPGIPQLTRKLKANSQSLCLILSRAPDHTTSPPVIHWGAWFMFLLLTKWKIKGNNGDFQLKPTTIGFHSCNSRNSTLTKHFVCIFYSFLNEHWTPHLYLWLFTLQGWLNTFHSCKHGRSTEVTELQCVFSMLQYNKGHIQHMQSPIFAFEK